MLLLHRDCAYCYHLCGKTFSSAGLGVGKPQLQHSSHSKNDSRCSEPSNAIIYYRIRFFACVMIWLGASKQVDFLNTDCRAQQEPYPSSLQSRSNMSFGFFQRTWKEKKTKMRFGKRSDMFSKFSCRVKENIFLLPSRNSRVFRNV